MPGVISLLPEPFSSRVEDLWEAMQSEFGVPKGHPGAVPHITFHIGANDVETGAEAVVERLTSATPPFNISTAGLGVFGGSPPILHLMVARSPAVAALAEGLERELSTAGFPSTDAYFTPEKWIPHITIANRNLDGVDLGRLLPWLIRQDLNWEIPIRTISVARETDAGAEILSTFPLGG